MPTEIEEARELPTRPDSVAEWEDLLVRLEIAPRAVRVTLEEVEDRTSAARALRSATYREAEVGRLLEVAADLPRSVGREAGVLAEDGLSDLSIRFASLRARTFAMVQRRGLEVWEWRAPLPSGFPVTVHQLLLWLAKQDAALLAELRRVRRSGWGGC
ncbi:MAG TPA: hypothetical protein VF167_09435 [Longimicrobiaceae bacterium]